MAYTAIDKPEDHFNILTYSGNNTNNRSITGLGFQPDFTWIKMRQSQISDHALFDSNRGTNKKLASNSTATEVDPTLYGGVGSFDSDGFTLVNGTTAVLSSYMFEVNKTSETYVAWNWKANGGTTSTNTDGVISSTVQVNSDAGFSILTYTMGSGNDTVGHGLGVAPDVVITKARYRGDANGFWSVYTTVFDGSLDYLKLDDTSSKANSSLAAPTSTVFTGAGSSTVSYRDFVAYCFAEKQGYSKFGQYVGNGSTDGPFVYTGFKPAFVIVKQRNTARAWQVVDNKRDGYNELNMPYLQPNDTAVESSGAGVRIDLVSNGFKVRSSQTGANQSAGTYFYMAFAENPFVTSTGIPATAR